MDLRDRWVAILSVSAVQLADIALLNIYSKLREAMTSYLGNASERLRTIKPLAMPSRIWSKGYTHPLLIEL